MYFSIDRTGHVALPGISYINPPSWASESSLWFLVSSSAGTHNVCLEHL